MTPATRTALVADVGGTRTRLALADGPSTLRDVRVFATPSGSLLPLLHGYLEDSGARVGRCAVAAAGRIRREHGGARVTLTNVALEIDAAELRGFGEGPLLVNDLAAVAAALPHFAPADLEGLDACGDTLQGARLVLGVGTGIGAAVRLADGALLETEAGHVELAAVAPSQRDWLAALPRQRASAEELLAGPGLLRLHAQVGGEPGIPVPALIERARAGDASASARTMLSAIPKNNIATPHSVADPITIAP